MLLASISRFCAGHELIHIDVVITKMYHLVVNLQPALIGILHDISPSITSLRYDSSERGQLEIARFVISRLSMIGIAI